MRSYEASGKTVEEAISAGLAQLGLSLAEVEVDILDEGSKGLFGLFGSKMARVRVTAKEGEEGTDTAALFPDSLDDYRTGRPAAQKARKPEPRPQPARKAQEQPKEQAPAQPKRPSKPKPEAEPVKAAAAEEAEAPKKPSRNRRRKPAARKPEETMEISERVPAVPPTPAEQRDPATQEGQVQTFLQEVTRLMGVPVSVHVKTDDEGNIRVTMEGDTLGILIGRRGETLDALQYLTGLHLNRGQEGYTRVTLDSEGYRAKREDALIRLANRMANRAEKTGRRVSLEPMNPYERRVLHSALQGRTGITTHSEGEEPNRHVVITLTKQKADDTPEAE